MRSFFSFLFVSFLFLVNAQSTIKIVDQKSNLPISGAHLKCNENIIGTTNEKGFAQISTICKNISVEANGYYKENVDVQPQIEIELLPISANTKTIEEVVIEDKTDPRALEILRLVNKNFKKNSPKSLSSYTFKSYEKIGLDIDIDSVSVFTEYVNKNLNTLISKKNKDSAEDTFTKKLFTKSQLFLWERAQEFLFSKKYGEKINILDNRISGLKQPIYEMIALQTNRDKLPVQLNEENRGLYRFFLTDTIEIDGRENYEIRFREVNFKKKNSGRKYSGYIYVDKETYGIKKIESESRKRDEGNLTSTWIFYNNKWFLSEEKVKFKLGRMLMKDDKKDSLQSTKQKETFGTYATLQSHYFDFKTPIEERKKDFEGYTFTVKSMNGQFLEQYRTSPLSLREENTYKTLDSLGNKYKIDRKAQVLVGLINGAIRLGKVDVDLGELVNVNSQEGLRLGLRLKLNETLHPYLSPDAYFAYGFKDLDWKYGVGLDIKTTLEKNSFFRLQFTDDVRPSGEFNRNIWSFMMRMKNYGNNLNNNKYYNFRGVSLAYNNDITNGITMIFGAKRFSENALFDYNFMNKGNEFENFNLNYTFKFSPNSTNIMTPQGKTIIDQKFPELYINYDQGFKAFGGDFNYSRFDFLFVHNVKTILGTTGFRLYGGLVLGKAPIWHHFTMNGLATNSKFNFNLTSYLGFATLEGGKYFNDKFVTYYLTHRLPWYFKSLGQNVSSFNFVLRGGIGNMKHPEYHQMSFKKLDHLYQEVGLEWNNFLSSYFNLGFFYRVGYYTTPSFRQNFAIQFKLKLLEF